MSAQLRGLTLYVARTVGLGDCTAGGISSKFEKLTLVGWYEDIQSRKSVHRMPCDSRVFQPTPDSPPVLIHRRVIGHPVLSIVPATDEGLPAPGWFMAGGNFAEGSDSRISNLIRSLLGHDFYGALAIHDRLEP